MRVLQREWGMRIQPADGGKKATGAGLDRTSFSALVVAWDMPRISLCSGSAERFQMADPSEDLALRPRRAGLAETASGPPLLAKFSTWGRFCRGFAAL